MLQLGRHCSLWRDTLLESWAVWSLDSSKVLIASEDKAVRVWDVATGQHMQWAAQK